MICPKNFSAPLWRIRISSGEKQNFLPWKFTFPRLELFLEALCVVLSVAGSGLVNTPYTAVAPPDTKTKWGYS